VNTISRWLDKFCYDHPNFGLSDLMKYIAIGNVTIYLMDLFSNGFASLWLSFRPSLILRGQIWRLITFIFVPLNGYGGGLLSVLFFAMSVFFYYWIGTALERQWGTARFNIFYLLGIVLNIALGLIFRMGVNMYYVNMSMFFSFATLYPDMQVLLYGILPLKVKWLAWLDAVLFGIDILQCLIAGQWILALLPVIALLNYFIFFWGDLTGAVSRKAQRTAYRASARTIDFKKAQKEIQQKRGYLHKCAVCGITDADDPDMEFRYCSKCNGYYCYCMKHINDHVHVQ